MAPQRRIRFVAPPSATSLSATLTARIRRRLQLAAILRRRGVSPPPPRTSFETFELDQAVDIAGGLRVAQTLIAPQDLVQLIEAARRGVRSPTNLASSFASSAISAFLVGVTTVPERLTVASTVAALRRGIAIVDDIAIPRVHRETLARIVEQASGIIHLTPGDEQAGVARAVNRWLLIHASLAAEIARHTRLHAPILTDVAAYLRTGAGCAGIDLNVARLIRATVRAVFDDAIPSHAVDAASIAIVDELRRHERTIWPRTRVSRAMSSPRPAPRPDRIAPIALAHAVVAAVHGINRGSIRKAEARAGTLGVRDGYGEKLRGHLFEHPAFWRGSTARQRPFRALTEWLAYEHPPWEPGDHATSPPADVAL